MNRFSQKSTNQFYIFIILALLSIAIIVLDHQYKKITQIRSTINDLVVYPIERLSNFPRLVLEEVIRESSDIDNLEEKLSLLKKENLDLKIKLQELESLKGENVRLRKISKESSALSSKQTIVKVINTSASPTKKVILIDKGTKHGIYQGQNVIGTKGLVGQIIETNSLSSKVMLITEPTHDIPGQINRTGQKVIVSGSDNDEKLIINYANINSDIVVGDEISTSGIANRFKPKIPIGIITKVGDNLDAEFKEVEIQPFEYPDKMPELILIWDYMPKENNNE
jgi:rod shape-determining protein MreC